MPFFFNIKFLFFVISFIVLIFSIIFFFAFFALITLPFFLLVYVFRKKIFKNIIIKNIPPNAHNFNNKQQESNIYKNRNNFIEVDYENKTEKDINN